MSTSFAAEKKRSPRRRSLREQIDDVRELPSRVPYVVTPKR